MIDPDVTAGADGPVERPPRGLLTSGAITAVNQAMCSDATSRQSGLPLALSYFATAADAFEHAADIEVAYAREMPSRAAAVETMLVGTVVIEQALVQVRRLALEAASFRIEAANDKGQ